MSLFKTFRLVPARDCIRGEGDEWSGISDAKERKKRQNRINQRAARRRHRLSQLPEHQIVPRNPGRPTGSHLQLGNANTARSSPIRVDLTETYFPLTRDAQLLHVITLNVSRAILANYVVLSSVPLSTDRFCSIRRVLSLPPPIESPIGGTSMTATFVLPPSLMPTLMQQQVPHYGWIDLFPSPRLRDNLIVALDRDNLDEDAFMMDVLGDAFESLCSGAEDGQGQADELEAIAGREVSDNISEASSPLPVGTSRAVEPGLVSWSDPWDIAGWEVTAEFIHKWGFLLQGCQDVVMATNIWRERRGDDPLTCSV